MSKRFIMAGLVALVLFAFVKVISNGKSPRENFYRSHPECAGDQPCEDR